MLSQSTILLTGGTGSFGHAFVPMTLARYNPRKLIIYSRDEMKQWNMAKLYKDDPRVRFFIGDVRDKDRLYRALDGVDFVVHAAATKIVPTAEYNPFECIKTNVMGAMNLVDACIDRGVKKLVALSTDKASSPVNLYGATKLVSDKVFIAGNSYAGGKKTRFMITLEQGVELVWHAFDDMVGGEIYVKKIPSMNICDIARAVDPGCEQKIVGIRPGEKLHEQMIGVEDAPHTYEYSDHYKILPAIHNWDSDGGRIKDGKRVPDGFSYCSDTNSSWMTIPELRAWIDANRAKIGSI